VDEVSYLHWADCSLMLNTCQLGKRIDAETSIEDTQNLEKQRSSACPNTQNIYNSLNELGCPNVELTTDCGFFATYESPSVAVSWFTIKTYSSPI
jgi:hypothetical protein